MDIFRKNALHLNLTPAQRAFLRWVDTQLIAAVAAGAVAIGWAFTAAGGQLTWLDILHAFLVAVLTAIGMSVQKYIRAQGEPPLSQLADEGVKAVEKKLNVSDQQVAQIGQIVDQTPAPDKSANPLG